MVTQEGENVLVLGVRGNFDEAQSGVKSIFSDAALADRLKRAGVVFSSANSINWGRLAPQIAYYYSAYAQLLASGDFHMGDTVDFSVPTGNFGDIMAGYLAKLSGLPVGRLICASNANNVLTDFLHTGIYDKNREFFLTMSPSMDILVSSNLERLLYFLSGDPGQVAAWMKNLNESGKYDAGPVREIAKRAGFEGCSANEAQTARTILETWNEYRCLVDPHTAVGLFAARQQRSGTNVDPHCVVLSTASPFKFARSMLTALGQMCPQSGFDAQDVLSDYTRQPIPAPLRSLREKRERFPRVVDPSEMSGTIEEWLA